MKRMKKIFVRIHIFLWVLFSLLLSLQISQENHRWLPVSTGVVLTSLYVFYSHFRLLTRYSGQRKRRAYFVRLALVGLTGPLPYLLFHFTKPYTWDHFTEGYFITFFSVVVPFLFLSWLARVTENLLMNTVLKEQLEKQVVESELVYLKSQINPHFLFNTLNNIHTLVYKQAPTAPDAVMQMASLMRYMIYESNAPTVPLAREIEYLQDYISLQQLRYRESPVVELTITGSIETCGIAPLLFIHLLENAYKHSPARLAPGDIKITVEVANDVLTFSVQNPIGAKPTHNLDLPGGFGLPNIRKRLQLLYPHRHRLELQRDGDTFAAVLTLHDLQTTAHERKADLLYH